jgi:hypothetical protein
MENGYSKYGDILVNRFKETSDYKQGIFFYIKNVKNKNIWTSTNTNKLSNPDRYKAIFSRKYDKV